MGTTGWRDSHNIVGFDGKNCILDFSTCQVTFLLPEEPIRKVYKKKKPAIMTGFFRKMPKATEWLSGFRAFNLRDIFRRDRRITSDAPVGDHGAACRLEDEPLA